jgi:hypothetical protein
MERSPAPILVHRLSAAEQRVLTSFLSGRLPAGQVNAELARARALVAEAAAESAAPTQAPAPQPVSAVAA